MALVMSGLQSGLKSNRTVITSLMPPPPLRDKLHRHGLSSLPEVTSYKAIQIGFLCFFGMPYLASLTDNFNSQKHHEDEVSNTQNTGSPDVRRVVLVLRRISILEIHACSNPSP